MSYAKVTLVGNVGREPEFKTFGDSEVCNLSLAVTSRKKGEKVTTWWTIASWSERTNKVISEYVSTGSQILVCGEPSVRAYTNKSGETVAQLEVNISFGDLVLLAGKREEQDRAPDPKPRGNDRGARAATRKPAPPNDIDTDVPF